MIFEYLITPFAAWLVAGCLKFLINSLRSGGAAFSQIGYGGLPSNHTSIVISTATLIALKEGFDHPAFGVAITLAFIVVLDASSLRRQIGRHAVTINELAGKSAGSREIPALRERVGHTPLEIVAGVVVGILVAWAVRFVL